MRAGPPVLSAANGLGVTRLYSFHVADKVRDKGLQIVLAHAEPAPVAVHLVAQRFSMPVPKVRAFTDFAVPVSQAKESAYSSAPTAAPHMPPVVRRVEDCLPSDGHSLYPRISLTNRSPRSSWKSE